MKAKIPQILVALLLIVAVLTVVILMVLGYFARQQVGVMHNLAAG